MEPLLIPKFVAICISPNTLLIVVRLILLGGTSDVLSATKSNDASPIKLVSASIFPSPQSGSVISDSVQIKVTVKR